MKDVTIFTKKALSKLRKATVGFLILTSLFLLGEWISGYLPFPVPGAVIGMIIVFVLLQFGILPLRWVDTTATWLLAFLGLFYVPYGVGIVESGTLIREWGLQIILVMIGVVILVFFVSGKSFLWLTRHKMGEDE